MILPDGWSWGTIPAAGDLPEIRYGYRRYTGHDRLQVLGWWQRQAEALDRGDDPIEIAQEDLRLECEAMAQRLVDSQGVPWTFAALHELAGVRPEAFSELSRTLYGPAYAELDGDTAQKKRLLRPFRYLRGIQRLFYALAHSASDTSTSSGTQAIESADDHSVPMVAGAGR